MSVNLLAINVGNSRTQLGVFAEGELAEHRSLSHEASDAELSEALGQFHEQVRESEDPAVFIASVNEPAAERLADLAHRVTGQHALRMERDVPIPIGRQLDAEAIAGEDRLLNAAGAYDKIQEACIIVDAGTALTVDFIDGDGTFHGGAILPGPGMMLDALHKRTAGLPKVELAAPAEPIGHNTEEAMRCGTVIGLRGAVRELVESYAEFYGAFPKVIATGGDAELLFGRYELIEVIVPELALRGMAAARRHQTQPEQ
jgi:type III pantothenate kinase